MPGSGFLIRCQQNLDFGFVKLYYGLQSLSLRVPQAKIFRILESGFSYMGRIFTDLRTIAGLQIGKKWQWSSIEINLEPVFKQRSWKALFFGISRFVRYTGRLDWLKVQDFVSQIKCALQLDHFWVQFKLCSYLWGRMFYHPLNNLLRKHNCSIPGC